MTNDCKTCPVSTGTHKPAEAVHQIDEPQADALLELAAYRFTVENREARIAELEKENSYLNNSCAALEQRLEIDPRHRYDGISARDATIEAQDERIAELESQLEAIGAGGVEPLRKQAVQAAVPATNHSETPNSSTIIVPYGWKLVPDDATPEWVTNLEALPDWREAVGECIKRFLAAAPAHPAEGVPAQAAQPSDALIEAVDAWFAENTGLGGCSDKDVSELAEIFATHPTQQGLEPTMFWDADDPERCESSINNVVVEVDNCRGLRVGDIVTIQRAVRLLNLEVRITQCPDAEGNGDLEWDEVVAAQAKQGGV